MAKHVARRASAADAVRYPFGFGGRAPYGKLPPLPGWSLMPPPAAVEQWLRFPAPLDGRSLRRQRLRGMKQAARDLERFLNGLWEEIVRLEDEDGGTRSAVRERRSASEEE
jgi:hypothetical protein